jgi:hypothetical protein
LWNALRKNAAANKGPLKVIATFAGRVKWRWKPANRQYGKRTRSRLEGFAANGTSRPCALSRFNWRGGQPACAARFIVHRINGSGCRHTATVFKDKSGAAPLA